MYGKPDLETFVIVARRGGVTAAARQLDISPATTSHRIAKLEHVLKVTLFHRNSRNFVLTDEGQLFLERVEPILEELTRAEEDAGAGNSSIRGHLRATMSPWILSRYVLPMLPELQKAYPDLTLEFLSVDRFVPLVEEGQDCAIRVGQLSDSALRARKISDNERVICASPKFIQQFGMPSQFDDLAGAKWVSLPWQMKLELCGQDGRPRPLSLERNISVSNSDMLTEATVNGLGLAVKSRLAIMDELNDGQLIEIMPGALHSPQAPVWFVTPSDARASRKIKLFGELVNRAFNSDK